MSEPFVKHNRSAYPDQLLREARGLEALRAAAAGSGVDVPQVLQVDEATLTLPRIGATRCSPEQWVRLGRGLAAIHARPQPGFGFEEDNYIGLAPQRNGARASWGRFFLEQRLEFQVGRIEDARRRRQFAQVLARQAARLQAFLDAEAVAPSLVHGDLWSGNVLCGDDGRVWLIDPAPYRGDADVDLAMTRMFGGFPAAFYAAYRAQRPAAPAFARKAPIYNLYHYLNHLNLFGDAYLDGCESGLAALAAL